MRAYQIQSTRESLVVKVGDAEPTCWRCTYGGVDSVQRAVRSNNVLPAHIAPALRHNALVTVLRRSFLMVDLP